MSESDPTRLADELLAHRDFVARLARRLAGPDAEDLEQETWLAMLRRPPATDRPIEPWISTVMRNLFRKLSSGRAASRAREEDAARPEAQSAQDPVEREELRQRLVARVLALGPELRETITLRYVEGLSPKAIAERLEVPSGTVRWRLSAALSKLRERTQREEGADWRPALLAIATPRIVPLGGSALAMAGVLVLLLAAAVTVGAIQLWPGEGPGGVEGRAAALEPAQAASRDALDREPPAPSVTDPLARQDAGQGKRHPAPPSPDRPRGVHGTVRASDRGPLAGHRVTFTPAGGAPVTTTTDGDGAFAFPLASGKRGQIEIQSTGYMPFLQGDVPAGDPLSVLLMATYRRVEVAGRVLDPHGKPIPRFRVSVRARLSPASPPQLLSEGEHEDEDGRFSAGGDLIAFLSVELLIDVVADGYRASSLSLRDVVVGTSEASEIEVVLQTGRGGLSGRVTGPDGTPVADALVQAFSDDGPEPAVFTDEDGRFEHTSLGAAPIRRVVVRDDHFAPAILEHARDWSQLDVRLERGGELRIRAIDRDGSPLSDDSLELRFPGDTVDVFTSGGGAWWEGAKGAFLASHGPTWRAKVDLDENGIGRAEQLPHRDLIAVVSELVNGVYREWHFPVPAGSVEVLVKLDTGRRVTWTPRILGLEEDARELRFEVHARGRLVVAGICDSEETAELVGLPSRSTLRLSMDGDLLWQGALGEGDQALGELMLVLPDPVGAGKQGIGG